MLRVGSVPYLVARPLDSGLENEPSIDFTRQVPAELVRRLRADELDVALVSSIELFRQPGYGYLDGLAVAGTGFVASVQVFLRRPVEEARTIHLDPSSRAAAALTQVVWPHRRTRFVELEPGQDPRAEDGDGWLRIGDRALREYWEAERKPVFNPGERWTKETGLLFPFAVWIVRPGVSIDDHVEVFLSAAERGGAAIEQLAREASRLWEVPLEATHDYLARECRYDVGSGLREPLLAFRERALALGLCGDHTPEVLAPRSSTGETAEREPIRDEVAPT